MTSNMTQLIFNTEQDFGTLDIVPQQNFSQISNYITFLLILRLIGKTNPRKKQAHFIFWGIN